MKPKLCYVLPTHKKNDATHFAHVHDFLKEINKSFDVFLLVEKGEAPGVELGCWKQKVFYFRWAPFRLAETFFVLARARLAGCKNFYIHYSFAAAFLASLIARISGARVFYWNCGEVWKYQRNFIRDCFEKATYRLVDFLVTGADSMAARYSEFYGIPLNKVKVMPNWIDLRRFQISKSKLEARKILGLPTDKKIVLFVHHLTPRKGSDMIIPVAQSLANLRQDAFFAVVGSGSGEGDIKDQLNNDAELSRTVRLEGAVSNIKIPDYFAATDVFFMPSREEGFPRVLLEAMATGTPFVASDVGAVAEIVPGPAREYVISFGDGVILKFAEKINSLLSKNKEEMEKYKIILKKRAGDYEISVIAKKFKELF